MVLQVLLVLRVVFSGVLVSLFLAKVLYFVEISYLWFRVVSYMAACQGVETSPRRGLHAGEPTANAAQARHYGPPRPRAAKPGLPDHPDALRQLQHVQCRLRRRRDQLPLAPGTYE